MRRVLAQIIHSVEVRVTLRKFIGVNWNLEFFEDAWWRVNLSCLIHFMNIEWDAVLIYVIFIRTLSSIHLYRLILSVKRLILVSVKASVWRTGHNPHRFSFNFI